MKRILFLLIIASAFSGCTMSRYYYQAEEPIDLYEFVTLKGKPLLRANVGDTVSATGTRTIQLGGSVPVEFKGYQFYAPAARARFLYVRKINPKTDAAIPAVAYTTVEKQKKEKQAILLEEAILRANEADTSYWYGQVGDATPVLDDAIASAEQITTVPHHAIVKIRRHDYNYWKVWINGKVGYINAFSVYYFSKSESPFVKTAYTGRTFDHDMQSSPRTNTPTTGAYIRTGPRGGHYYINSNGNKTYVRPRK